MKRLIVIVVMMLFALPCVHAEEKTEGGEVLAIINGTEITMDEFNEEIAGMPERYQSMIESNKEKFLDELILRKLLYQEAVKEGLDKDKEVVDTLEGIKEKIMSQKLVKDIIENIDVSEEEVKNYYNEHKDEFKLPEQVSAAHILIKVEDASDEAEDAAALKKAEGLLKEIEAGADFSELAKENSGCPSGQKGGELGYFSRGRMVPEFEEAAFNLKVGEVSGVVKTSFGYHIIKVLDKKEAKQEDLDEVKEKIENKLRGEKMKNAVQEYTENLKSKAKITINKELLQ